MGRQPNGNPNNGDGTVGKALDVLDLVAQHERPVRFSEIHAGSPFPKATLHRLLRTLTSSGMLMHDAETQTYAPGLRLVRLAHAAWKQSSLAPIARPYVDALASAVNETIHLAQMDAGRVLYVDKRNAVSPIEMFSQAGKTGPGYCTGVGKAIMAFLGPEEQDRAVQNQAFFAHTGNTLTNETVLREELSVIRKEGVAFDREEHEPGIICIAAPILASNGIAMGALSVTTSTVRSNLDQLKDYRPHIVKAAKEIAEAAENWRFPSM